MHRFIFQVKGKDWSFFVPNFLMSSFYFKVFEPMLSLFFSLDPPRYMLNLGCFWVSPSTWNLDCI